jgi:hypothetical protein
VTDFEIAIPFGERMPMSNKNKKTSSIVQCIDLELATPFGERMPMSNKMRKKNLVLMYNALIMLSPNID